MFNQTVKKLDIKEAALFAIQNIPQVDPISLERFVDLINVGSSHGCLSFEQLIAKVRLANRYLPNLCPYSLFILMDIVGMPLPKSCVDSRIFVNIIVDCSKKYHCE